jgi:hypothetical protein
MVRQTRSIGYAWPRHRASDRHIYWTNAGASSYRANSGT